jgi:hypothetical protein
MDIILLNNDAVKLMRQGREVISDFRSALAKLHCVDQHEGVDLADKVTPNFLSVRSAALDHSLFNTSSYEDHHAFSLFDRALIIDGNAKLVAASSIAGRDCTTAVVLFNSGLALHLRGIRDICSRQTSFKTALWLYKMAFDILERCSDSNDEVNRLVYLAAVNNMGHIYSHFCEGREAQHCLQLLHTMIETVKSSGIDVLSDEYLQFYMNASILRGREVSAAAAA